MNVETILHSDYLDILFDQRNKTYGSYELRKHYAQRIQKALLFMLLCIALLLCFINWLNTYKGIERQLINIHRTTDIFNYKQAVKQPILPKISPVHIAAATPDHIRTQSFSDPKIIKDNDLPDKLLAQNKDLKTATIGTNNTSGDNTTTDLSGPVAASGNGTGSAVVQLIAADKPFTYVSQMPEYQGNMNAYLTKNLRYPDAAREANISGKILVQFVVNEDGVISDAKIIRGIGGGCDEEALRVVNAMSKWKSGKQNGKAVKVFYTLPIVFALQ